MDNKLSNHKEYVPKLMRETAPYRVFATWNIHYACNFKCSYCHAAKPEHKDARKAVYIDSGKWLDIWKENYDRYGTWEILLSGGEPFIYPEFTRLIAELSKIHIVAVCTNLSWDAAYFVKHASPGRVRIETSFHPEFADLDKFTEKLKILKKNGFEPTVNFVPWPPLLDMMQRVKDGVEEAGCQLTLQPFIGKFKDRSYPQGYTEIEREYFKIFKDDCNLKTLDFKTTEKSDSTKGRLCRMGQNYCFIHPDGGASRCCRDHSFSLGNMIEGSFRLLEEPAVCKAENCNCWRCMLAGKEDLWLKNWGRQDLTELAIKKYNAKKSSEFRIALIQPPVWGIYEPPVALAQISSFLKRDGFIVSIFDLNIELYNKRKEEYKNNWAIEQSAFWANSDNVSRFFDDNRGVVEEYVNKVVETGPDLIAFSVNVCSLPATMELARSIKQKRPDSKIALGGPMFLVSSDIPGILKHDCIDIIVSGEGEETFCELSRFLFKGKDIGFCKGIYFKKDAKIIKTEERPAIKNLDELPFLDLESFPIEKYDPPGHLGKHVSLMASRGCILNCAYCGPKAYWTGFRFMSGNRIYREIKYHFSKDPGLEHIEFLDLELNGSIKPLEEFCDLMILQPPKKGVKWHANIVIRPEMDKELLSKMKEAGCDHLSIGIETGSQRILDLMKKRYRIEDAERVLRLAHEAGIRVTTNFMFGFPGETEEDFNLTLEFLRRNAPVIDTVYPSRSFFTIEPFSYIASHLDEFGIIVNPDNNLYWESRDGKNDYPERLRRCEEFSRLASELKVAVGLGLQTSFEQDRFFNLGFYYESRKDFGKAEHFFRKYLSLDKKNTVINKKLEELLLSGSGLNKETGIDPCDEGLQDRISFNWDVGYICNYRCPYCWFFGRWQEIKNKNVNIPVSRLIGFWEGMFKKYGKIKISITGGEPFLYPGFIDLITSIAAFHSIEVVTNLSWAVKALPEKIGHLKIILHPSFHPLFADFEEFCDKLIFLKDKGLAGNPSYVAWPPQIPAIQHYAGKFKERGAEMFVQPFFGKYKGSRYPDCYSDAERKIIRPYLGQRGEEPFQVTEYKTKGKFCYAGSRYGVIHPDGEVYRCGGIDSGDAKVGNILNNNFRLFSGASVCTSEVCPCNEWAFLLKEKEENEKVTQENR